ncbi:hypothetical protein [Desulfobacula sp.]|uniref:hypothetical protein n=1 Tax=Desulfobacula sp. TaxID=2593537 RepID=UPI00263962A8|nr:hypothetical protein [Desulfobacula sp.]
MTGISEILVLVLLITCIVILPRMLKGDPVKKGSSPKKILHKFTAKTRLAIILTLVYPLAAALYLKPWDDHLMRYISYGMIPVFLAWAVAWILAGKK